MSIQIQETQSYLSEGQLQSVQEQLATIAQIILGTLPTSTEGVVFTPFDPRPRIKGQCLIIRIETDPSFPSREVVVGRPDWIDKNCGH